MQQRISMTTLAVDDLEAAKTFFEEGLGWIAAAGGNDIIAFYQLPGAVFSLYSRQALERDLGREVPAESTGGISLAWNGASEAEVDSVFARAVAAGAEPIKQPEKVFWGGYSGYVGLPGGHLLEIAHNPFWAMDEKGAVTMPP